MMTNKDETEFRYFLEQLTIRDGNLFLKGWAHHPTRKIIRASVEVRDHLVFELRYRYRRTDVAEYLGSVNALKSGFFGYGPVPVKGDQPHLVFRFDDASQERIPLSLQGTGKRKLGYLGTRVKKGAILVSKVPLLLRRRHRSTLKTLLFQLIRGDIQDLFSFAKQVIVEHEIVRANLFADQERQELDSKLPNLSDALSCLAPAPPEVSPLPNPIVVIVPIYNGMDFLPRLIDSLLSHTASYHRFLLIDDASPDHRIWSFLRTSLGNHPNVTLMRNERNLGFVKTVNNAVEQVQGHFILLNSDVEVPPDWLERLMKPIIDHPDQVASTTPFSNAATICSFPEMNKDNELFADRSVTEIDAFFRYIQSGEEVELPTGVGFCMGFNYEVVKRIGMFDAETFGKGFGEENDWSQRALGLGYRNLLVPNLFVYHKHGGSFLEAKKPQLEKNLLKLKRLHPHYFQSVHEFCLEDSPGILRAAMIMKMAACLAAQPPLLIIDHDLGGGANQYRRRMIHETGKHDRAVLLLLSVLHSNTMYLMVSYRQYNTKFVLKSPDDLKSLEMFIPIGDIFYNNLVGCADPLAALNEIVALKQRSGAFMTVAIHDFLPICPAYNLLDINYAYCYPAEIDFCMECLPNNSLAAPVPDPNPVTWRKNWETALAESDSIVVFSESSRDILAGTYPLIKEKIAVRPHKPLTIFTKKPKIKNSRPINIGIVGGINVPKGRNVVAELARTIYQKRKPPMTLTVIGTLSPPLREKSLTVTGPYKPEDLPNLIESHGINIFLIPSIWPETFSFVAQELMDMAVPLCCFDLGAPSERIRRYSRGLILSSMEPETVLKEIEQFFESL